MILCGFDLLNLEGEPIIINVPMPGTSSENAMEIFGQASRRISDEWHARDKKQSASRDWLTRVSYQCVSLMIGNGFESLFVERATNYDRRIMLSNDRSTIFQMGLLAIFAHDKGAVRENDRYYIGRRQWFAYRHYVPAEFLIGFLHETWSREVDARFPDNEIERRFEVWVKLNRATDESPELRGSYPQELDEEVEAVRAMLPAIREVYST